jgi:hypothetical protein
MSKRQRLVVGLAVLALLFGGVVTHLHFQRRRPRCDFIAFKKIREGMTLREVRAIVGAPPGDYTVDGQDFPSMGDWREDVDEEGLVTAKSFHPGGCEVHSARQGALDWATDEIWYGSHGLIWSAPQKLVQGIW